MARKKSRRRSRRFPLRGLLLFLIGLSLPFGLYIVYLDRVVVSQFEGKRFSIPAKVYARPLELFIGKELSPQNLLAELALLNYSQSSQLSQAGQYRQQMGSVDIFIRPFTFWDEAQPAQKISLSFRGDKVSDLRSLEYNSELSLIRLEPQQIGGIYPNKGEDRELVRLEQVPQHLIDALIAIEDKRFYSHHGIDPKAILRAVFSLASGSRVQGGSTITQQLIKNFYLSSERTLQRKLKEMVMAILLEAHYSKEEILETYINEVYFGQDKNRAIHGFGLASQFFFSQSIEQLEAQQSALLVGMLKGPAYYNPRRHPERALQRRNLVLQEMHEQGMLNKPAFDRAKQKPIAVSPLPNIGQSPHPAFMDLVIRQLTRDYREEDLRSEGLRIFSTLDPITQNLAENVMQATLERLERNNKLPANHLEGAAVIVNVLDGEVEAIVGGRKSNYQGFNRALDASRQVGSLFKPAIYLTALSQPERYHLASVLDDSPFIWQERGTEDWQPQNYDKKFHGAVPLWYALAKSYNVSAARLGTELGVANVLHTAKQLGINKNMPPYASSLLGSVELTPYEITQMYHTIASGGFRTPFRAIREVTTSEGAPLSRYPLSVEQVIPALPNYLLVKALELVVTQGTGSALSSILPRGLVVAGKTGTTDGLRDSWFSGFSGDKVATVWVGNDKNEGIKLTGATAALDVWGHIMKDISASSISLQEPENIAFMKINRDSGFIASGSCMNTFDLPVEKNFIPQEARSCSGSDPAKKIKSWFNKILGK